VVKGGMNQGELSVEEKGHRKGRDVWTDTCVVRKQPKRGCQGLHQKEQTPEGGWVWRFRQKNWGVGDEVTRKKGPSKGPRNKKIGVGVSYHGIACSRTNNKTTKETNRGEKDHGEGKVDCPKEKEKATEGLTERGTRVHQKETKITDCRGVRKRAQKG